MKKVYVVQWGHCLAAFDKIEEAKKFSSFKDSPRLPAHVFILELHKTASEIIERYEDSNE